MQGIKLVADGDVISFMFKGTSLGDAYTELIDSRQTGITLLAVSSVAASRSVARCRGRMPGLRRPPCGSMCRW